MTVPDAPLHETGPALGHSPASDNDRAALAERHWAPPTAPPLLDGAFLAPKHDEQDRLAPFRLRRQTPDLRTSAEAVKARRLLLLGPPGMGKTTELDRMAAEVEGPSHIVRLAEITAPADVERLLRAAPVREWTAGGTLFLDAFDEGHADVRPLATTLAQALVDLDPDRMLALRITCRDADRPRSLEGALQTHYGDLTVLSLAPLLRADARAIAALTLGDEGAASFMAAVAQSAAEPLAAVPLTLTQLVGVYRSRGDLPESRSALFRAAVLLLAEETNPARYEAHRTGVLDAGQRVRLAARVAALLRFSGRTHLHLGPASEAATDALTVADVEGDERGGTAWTGPVRLSDALRDLARHSGLLTGDGWRFRFLHLAYEEFLAAEHLVEEGAPPESALVLLSHPGTGVRPQLRETAAVLAGSNPRFRDVLLETEPGLALRYGAAGLGGEARAGAVESFLESHDRGAADFWDRLPNAAALAHPGLAAQLARWALDGSRRHAARKAALSAAADAGCTAFAPTAVALALDRSEESALRHLAVLVALRLDPDTAHGALERLSDPGDDEDDEDRYIAFAVRRALFPDSLPVAQLTALLAADDARGGAQGASARSAAERFAQDVILDAYLPDRMLLEALDWVTQQETLGRSARPFADAVAEVAAARSPERPDAALALARALLGRGRKPHYSPPFEWPGDALRGDVARADAVRHAIAAAAVTVLAERDPYPDGWDERMGRLEHGLELLRSDDTLWVLDHLRAEPSAAGRRAWVGALWQTFYPGPHTDAVLSACLARPTIAELFPLYIQYFAAIETDGAAADHERARETRAAKNRAAQVRREAAARPDPPTPVRVDRALARIRPGSPKGWPAVVGALTLHPVDRRWFRQPFHDDFEQAATWSVLSAEQRDSVAREAEAFLRTPSAATGADSLHAAAAFRLLHEHAPDRFDALGDDIWRAHARTLVEVPFNSNATTSVNHRADLLERAYRFAPVEVTEALVQAVAAPTSESNRGAPLVLYAARRFWDVPLRTALTEAVRILAVAPPDGPWGTREWILESLLDDSVPEAAVVVVEQLEHDVTAGALLSGTAVWYAVRAFIAAPIEAWALLSGPIATDDALAEAFLRRYSAYTRRNPATDAYPGALADLYLRLHTVRPACDDPDRPDGMFHWDTDHGLRDLRNNLLSAITRQGTAEAVAAVERLARDGPPETDLLYSLRNAREEWARRDPAFLSPADVLRTARDPDAAPVRSDADLQAAALRALADLQRELTGQEQAASPDLWNTASGAGSARPKIEVEISDYVARYLQRALRGRGVSVVREAEVYAGSETDLRLSLPLDGGRHALLVVEVKGAWETGAVSGLRGQLAHRYLAQAGRRHGVHLVASFEQALWDTQDWRRAQRPDPVALLASLAAEADLAATDGYAIVPIVLRVRSHRNPRAAPAEDGPLTGHKSGRA